MNLHTKVTPAVLVGLILIASGCIGGIDDGQQANPSPDGNVNSSGTPEESLGNRTLELGHVSDGEVSPDNTVLNASNLSDDGFFVIDYSVRGDMRIEPVFGDGEIASMHRSTRTRLYQAMRNVSGSGSLYVSFEGEHYKVTIGDVWEGGPTVDPSDPQDDVAVGAERGVEATVDVTVRRSNTTVYKTRQTVDWNSTVAHSITEPGSYTLKVEWDNRTVVEAFSTTFLELADCNQQSWSFVLTEEGYRFQRHTTLLNCRDPADRSM